MVACKVASDLELPITAPRVEWVLPSTPGATSALLPDGEMALRRLLWAYEQRFAAWERWADECGRRGSP